MEEFRNGSAKKKIIRVERQEPVLVRPAADTFNGLYFLSNIDQTYPCPIEILFCFKHGKENIDPEILRQSLSDVLVKYYPFAGCLTTSWDEKILVRCTGDGVPFVEAVCENDISDLLGDDITLFRDKKLLRNFVCCLQDGLNSTLDVPLLQVQVTTFKCGGIILGMTFHHVLVDGKAFVDFVQSWAELTRGIPLSSIKPFLDRSILSPRQPPRIHFPHHEYTKKELKKQPFPPQNQEQWVYRSFRFEIDKLNELKDIATDGKFNPTSFEVINALAWIIRTKAYKLKPNETTQLLIAIDVRSKFDPPLPEGYFGNAIGWSCAECKVSELLKKPFSSIVKMVHDSIQVVTGDYMRSALDLYEVTRSELLTSANSYFATKWSRLAFYEVDFGWGKPEQVAPASLRDDLIVIVAEGKNRNNAILSMSLPKSVMEIFQEIMEREIKRIYSFPED